jgi:hypothetical protein
MLVWSSRILCIQTFDQSLGKLLTKLLKVTTEKIHLDSIAWWGKVLVHRERRLTRKDKAIKSKRIEDLVGISFGSGWPQLA